MPRIFTSANDPIDFCNRCMPNEDAAERKYGNVGDGPDGRGNCFAFDTEHPPYDYENYSCAKCGCTLTDENA